MVESMVDVERSDAPKGTPVGRRVFLGMLGLGAAGIVWGAKVQSGLERLLRPVTLNDRTGLTSFLPTSGRFRIYSVTGSLPSRSEADYRLTIDGLVDKPDDPLARRPARACRRPTSCVTSNASPDGGCPTCLGEASPSRSLLDQVGVKENASVPPPLVVRR